MAAAGPVPDELSIDSSHVKAHRSAAGSKRGSSRKRLAVRAAEERAKSMLWPMIAADRLPSRRETSPTSRWPFPSLEPPARGITNAGFRVGRLFFDHACKLGFEGI